MSGMLHAAADICPACNGTGVLSEPVEERFGGYIDGPAPAARTWLVRVSGHSGLSAEDAKSVYPFSERFKARERDALREMPDGMLVEHIARLRRHVVMAGEAGREFLDDLTRDRHDMATKELAWRNRAGDKGADRVKADVAWRERVDRIRQDADLEKLIAWENTQAKQYARGKWKCCCPFHADSSPSLDIDVNKGVWVCHGCRVGGDAFTYVELRYGLDFAGAVRHLEQRL